ncbi:MAG: Ig-like domain repeat protein [Anaerolineales bacterium]|nr:Ig-like domain repeat protein [Anaerolineales bacterium]
MTSNTTSGLFDIWGTSASSIYAAGQSGVVVRYDGSTWTKMVTNTSASFHGLWGSSTADIYAVGYAGAIRHYNGTAWSSMNSGITTSFNGIWVASPSEAFAVGSSGRIAHYDGSAWTSMTSGTTFALRAVWGFAGDQVFAVGDNGVVLLYDGVNWSSLPTGSISTLRDVWGSSPTDLFAVGNAGTILHYNGSTWTAMESKSTATIWDVWGSGPTDVFAVGDAGLILHYDGAAWSSMTSGTDKTLRGVWGSSPTNVFAVGASGTVRLYNGSTWNYVGTGTASTLYGVWGSSATNVFAVGTLGGALRYSGSGTFAILNSGTSSNLADVSGSTGAMVLAAGYGGTIIRYGAASNVSKAVIAPNPTPGQPITYTLAFSNTGLLKLTKVRLYDSVPPTVTINGVKTRGVTMVSIGVAPNYAWQVADLAPGAGGLVTLTGVISPTAPGGRIVLNQGILGAAGELTTTGESTFTVLPASTNITMTSAPTPTTVYGQITTLTATVSAKAPATGKPSGTVTFRKGAAVLGTGTLGADGKAAVNVTTLTTGANRIVATYNGDSNFLPATATTHTHTVVRAGTVNLVIAAPNPADLEQNVTTTAYVAAASPGAGTPTGVVTFYLGSRVVTAGLTAGVASVQTSTLPSGVTAITATYSGDGNFLPSTSGVFSETVRCRVYVTNINDSGPGSLRAAVTDACLATTILFTPTLQGQTISLTSGEIAIDKYINIEGLGSAQLAISGNDAGRIFNITPGFYSLVKDLTLEHGRSLAGSGGAILNQGILQVEDVVIANSAAMHGGAIANQGTLTVTNSSFTSNSALSNGGALADAGAGATYAIDNSTFQGNQAGNHGGVLYSAGAVYLARSIFAGNSAQVDGGALYQSGAITITTSTFTGNRASSDGGAAYVGASAIVSNSAFLTNSATANGGGWYQDGASPWSCMFCTFNGNTAANGGAMAIAGGNTTLVAGSVAGNSATGSGGGLVLIGGAAVLDNSTFHQNSAVAGGAINNMAYAALKNVTLLDNTASGALGGGINIGGSAVLTLSNSVLSNPTGGDCANSGTLNDGGYNIARDATCNLNAANHSQPATNALLGAFGDYGGNVQTAPLLPGSPAIDGGDLAVCAASALGAFDARGVTRPQGASCDSGACEAQAVTLAITNGDHQKTYVNTAFAQQLSAGVAGADWAGQIEPVNGGWVRFTAPATGPGATFAPSITVTIASGAAQLTVTANAATGAYSATVATAGPGNSVAFDLGNELRATSVAQAMAPNPAHVNRR